MKTLDERVTLGSGDPAWPDDTCLTGGHAVEGGTGPVRVSPAVSSSDVRLSAFMLHMLRPPGA